MKMSLLYNQFLKCNFKEFDPIVRAYQKESNIDAAAETLKNK